MLLQARSVLLVSRSGVFWGRLKDGNEKVDDKRWSLWGLGVEFCAFSARTLGRVRVWCVDASVCNATLDC